VDQVIVLTGASSGIGRETAVQLAQRGAQLVLAGRNRAALDEVAAEVTRLGGGALVVPTDVTDYAQVTALAQAAATKFGRIDAWINNAGVWAFGPVAEQDVAAIRRVVEVDLLGAIHGMKAALPHLRHTGGTIVNVSSVAARRGIPLQAAYSAAKHGLSAFGEALRLELRHERAPVRIVEILPATINTPLFRHGYRAPGVAPRPIPPIYEPRVVAAAILAALRRPVREVFVGGPARLVDIAQRISPALLDWLLLTPGRIVQRQYDGHEPAAPNLWQPEPGLGEVTGSADSRSKSVSVYTALIGTRPGWAKAAAALLLAGAAALSRRARTR
jgi:NAD(P)-dependent dehydrogenase (short-subunit alcohol dehydrogenase family)